jgi:hypothetical protein
MQSGYELEHHMLCLLGKARLLQQTTSVADIIMEVLQLSMNNSHDWSAMHR